MSSPSTPSASEANAGGALNSLAKFVTPDGACEGASVVGMVHHTTLSIWHAIRKTLALGASAVPLTASAVLTPTSKILFGLPYLISTRINRVLHDSGEHLYRGVSGAGA